jgi:parallel beta-helix repeat protein/predicted outer membrane repeat protein
MRHRAARAPAAFLAALLLAALLLAPAPAAARRLFVPREHPTIQAAVDAAAPGDTVWVAAGRYAGTVRITKRLVVFGDGGPDSTFIEGGDSTRVVHVEGVNGGQLVGFTIRGGKAPGGGGIYCLRDTTFQISSCTVERNWEAGVALWQSSGIALLDNVFRDNLGSGVAAHGAILFARRNRFIGNSAPMGGGLYLERSGLVGQLQDCLFENNRAESGTGGALHADSSVVRVLSCTFAENRAYTAGGGIAAMNGSEVWVGQTIFRGNRAGTGGGVHGDRSTVNVAHCIFDRNTVRAAGAAIQILGRLLPNVDPILSDNTFHRNSGESGAADIFCEGIGPEIRKSIFVLEGATRPVIASRGTPTYDCNLIHDPTGAMAGSLPSGSTLVGDPRFCDPEKGDFRIRDLSPAFLAPCGPVGALKKPCSSFSTLPAR